MKYNAEQIGKIIFTERTKLGISQTELGKKINLVGKQISNYENGKTIPPIEIMFKLCDVFNCELGYLLNEPSYSNGTKLETAIINKTGLTSESLAVIKKITGKTKSCLDFGYEANSYRSILNSLVSSIHFIDFIECLHDLDNAVSNFKKIFPSIETQIGNKRLNEAISNNNPIDYESGFYTTTSLSHNQHEDMEMVEYGIDKQRDLSYSIKIARYELHEAFETLIEDLYPRES